MDRRNFLKTTGAASAMALAPLTGRAVYPYPAPLELMGNRFLTLSIVIRTTCVEVSRDVKPIKTDEYEIHNLKRVRALREAFRDGCPDGRLTWQISLNALEDQRPNFREVRDYLVEYVKTYGDEITYGPCYFAPMYLPRDRVNREMSEALGLISEMVGGGYRPKSLMGGFLAADNMRHLAEKENIHVAQGVIWSQYGIDAGDADGSPSYPYYPSREHLCKPAQGPADFIDCVNLDGWTMDFICAQRYGMNGHGPRSFNSRRGMGPIETYGGLGLETGHREVMHSAAVHFDRGFDLNGFGWVTSIWEAALVGQYERPFKEKDLMVKSMRKWIGDTKARWPGTKIVTFGEFGEAWRKHCRDNGGMNYRFEARGSGIADSKEYLNVRWFMNKDFRLGLIRDDRKQNNPELVMDFTRYDLPAREPADPTPDKPTRNWSLVNRINQKELRPEDKRVRLEELRDDDRALIASRYPELR